MSLHHDEQECNAAGPAREAGAATWEYFRVGKFTIGRQGSGSGNIWIERADGEGTGCNERDLEIALGDFYAEHF